VLASSIDSHARVELARLRRDLAWFGTGGAELWLRSGWHGSEWSQDHVGEGGALRVPTLIHIPQRT